MEQVHGRAEVIIGKQRHGPTGTVQMQFEAEVTRFANLAGEDHLPERVRIEGVIRSEPPHVGRDSDATAIGLDAIARSPRPGHDPSGYLT